MDLLSTFQICNLLLDSRLEGPYGCLFVVAGAAASAADGGHQVCGFCFLISCLVLVLACGLQGKVVTHDLFICGFSNDPAVTHGFSYDQSDVIPFRCFLNDIRSLIGCSLLPCDTLAADIC
ncbi:hypothetical protein Ccrd_005612 [Cynara cardunculus var. scolymus]|uniref:Uncharacterized protein n=1 Tax=Cynara cardunculus var. scolymus TaxID=59895 RepID=A0A103XKF7_CYNCS|nr:hypothetical protein Ccrd_005612 [Cynara cardunculus var. scolymus]